MTDLEGKTKLEDVMKQLSLPLEEEEVAEEKPAESKPARQAKKGFVRVHRDSEVAKSYSDNVALGYAVAKGLAQVLKSMSPADLAALKARVAEAADRTAKKTAAKRSQVRGWLQES